MRKMTVSFVSGAVLVMALAIAGCGSDADADSGAGGVVTPIGQDAETGDSAPAPTGKACDLNGEAYPNNTESVFGSTETGECTLVSRKCVDGAWSTAVSPVEPAIETCDGKDNDCNGVVDNDTEHPGQKLPDCPKCDPMAVETCGDHIDNNCNGQLDEGCPEQGCDPSHYKPETCVIPGLKALCAYGTRNCEPDGNWGACKPTMLPAQEICGNKADDDCDGTIDNNCACVAGDTVTCTTGQPGECMVGEALCGEDEAWGPCAFKNVPTLESCGSDGTGNGKDDNCDGKVDETCACELGDVKYCETGQPGLCVYGTQECVAKGTGTGWSPCSPMRLPETETCKNGQDEDCDGTADEGCACEPDTYIGCATGIHGVCSIGKERCLSDGSGYSGVCEPLTEASLEVCTNGLDDDCDGMADEGCECDPTDPETSVRPCLTGLPGQCAGGHRECAAKPGSGGEWGDCIPDAQPTKDLCGDGIDQNCDGVTDDHCPTACVPDEIEYCITAQLGVCRWGLKQCNGFGNAWSDCFSLTEPSPEICGDGQDEDCDGTADEGCACEPGHPIGCPVPGAEGACSKGTMYCLADGTGYTGVCEQVVAPSIDKCWNGLDEDCDGDPDDGCACTAGAKQGCQTGLPGACILGEMECLASGGKTFWGQCLPKNPPSAEVCGDHLDNDCDGATDESCSTVCEPDSVAYCDSGEQGLCKAGTRICDHAGSGYGPCVPNGGPTAEVCGNGLDEDCDGTADEGCVCAPGSSIYCQVPDAHGPCVDGKMDCLADGTGYTGVCEQLVGPEQDICANGLDEDCDGAPDDGCVCAPPETQYCDTGLQGACVLGQEACLLSGGVAYWGECLPLTPPIAEVCGNGLDDDCDGATDDGCATFCEPDSTEYCDSGLPGLCAAGTRTCDHAGSGYGPCVQSTAPSTEVCSSGLDEDCDGETDEGCVCVPDSTIACPVPDTHGPCMEGVRRCLADGSGYAEACEQTVAPSPDACDDGIDQDCDGAPDDECLCEPGKYGSCTTELPGVCKLGKMRCHGAAGKSFWGPCTPIIVPGTELCGNALDDNCNGAVDEGCATP